MPDLKQRLSEYGDVLEKAAPRVTSDEINLHLATPTPPRRWWQHPVAVSMAGAALIAVVVGGAGLLFSGEEQDPSTATTTPPVGTTVPETTPTTVEETPSTTLPLPSGDVVPLTPDQQEVAGVLLEAAETLGVAELEIEIEDDAGIENDGVGAAGRATSLDANGHAMSVGLIKFKSVDAAVAYLDTAGRGFQVGLGGIQQTAPEPAYQDADRSIPLPAGWDQSVGFKLEGGRGPGPTLYWVRSGVWVVERSIVVYEGGGGNAYDDAAEGLADTQARVDTIFGAVGSPYAPVVTVYFDPPPPPSTPDVYTVDVEIYAALPGYGDGPDEREWQGLAWRFGYTHGGPEAGTCDTWHVPLGDMEPTVLDVYVPQPDGSVRWTASGPGRDGVSSIPADDPQYLAALSQCTRYPADAESWGVPVPDPQPDLGALAPIRVAAGEYIATVAESPRPHEEELSASQVLALGIISPASGIDVVSAEMSIRTDGLTSIGLVLRGSTAALGEELGLDFGDLGSGVIDVEYSILAFPGGRD